jgi:hypothetical protein
MKSKLIGLLAASLLFPSIALAGAAVKRGPGPRRLSTEVYNVLDYGAVHDAEEATCDTGEDTPMDCTVAGTGTNDGPAITAAIAAAGAAGGGTVYMPCGKYRIGDTAFLTDSVLIQYDNITLQGAGACTVLLPAGSSAGGQYTVVVCEDATTTTPTCDGSAALSNITLRDFVIRDDDPYSKGINNIAVVTASTVGNHLFAEDVIFTGSNVTGEFYWWSGDDPGTVIVTNMSGTPLQTDTLDGVFSGQTADVDTVDSVPGTSEETHGIAVVNTDGGLRLRTSGLSS